MSRIYNYFQSWPIFVGLLTWHFYRPFSIISTCIGIALVYLFPVPSIPKPTGRFQVSSFDDELPTDRPLFWNNESEKRTIYYKVFYPCQHTPKHSKKEHLIGYFNKRMSFVCQGLKFPMFLLNHLQHSTSHTYVNQPALKKEFPVVVISHGLTGTFDSHFSLAQSISSHGYIVVVCDHIGCASVSYLPKSDKLYTYMARLNEMPLVDAFNKRRQHVEIRVQDVRDLIIKLKLRNSDINDMLYGCYKLNSVHLVGHSLGGATCLSIEMPCIKSVVVLDAWTFPLTTSRILQPPLRHMLAIQAKSWFILGEDYGRHNDLDIYNYCRNVVYPLDIEHEERDELDKSVYGKIQQSTSESGYKAFLVKVPLGHIDFTDVKFMIHSFVLRLINLYRAECSPLQLHYYLDRCIVGFINGVVAESFAGLESDLTKLNGSEMEIF